MDALSRAYPPEIIYEDFERDIDSEKFIHLMSKHSYVKDEKTEQIRNEIVSNSTMHTTCPVNQVRLALQKKLCQS